MLSKHENRVMAAVYSLCDGTDGCLVSPLDILSVMPAKNRLSPERLDDILSELQSDGYFDLIHSERKGEKMYVINMKESGHSFMREARQRKRDVSFRIFLAFIGAFATFIFGLILKAVFGG